MVTGPTKGVGKSITAINLAIRIARHGQMTALLVDLDLRDPSVHTYFGFNPEKNIADILQGNAAIEETLVSPGIERLTVLPGKDRHENSSEMLGSQPMQKIINEVVNRYSERIVIFDMPPILGCDDVAVLSSSIKNCLFVTKQGQTTRGEVQEAISRLSGSKLVGTVMNNSKGSDFNRYYY